MSTMGLRSSRQTNQRDDQRREKMNSNYTLNSIFNQEIMTAMRSLKQNKKNKNFRLRLKSKMLKHQQQHQLKFKKINTSSHLKTQLTMQRSMIISIKIIPLIGVSTLKNPKFYLFASINRSLIGLSHKCHEIN